MPTIPNLRQDSVQLETRTGRRQVQAGADAFGGQEASALAGVAQSLNRAAGVADAKLDEIAEAEARDYDNQFERALLDRLTNTEDGYLSTTRERAALDRRTQAEGEIDTLAVNFAGQIQNPRARQMFEQVARQRVTSALGQIASHASTQSTAYLDRQLQIAQDNAIQQGVAMAHDPAEVEAQFNSLNSYLERRRQINGWTDEDFATLRSQAQSDFYVSVISGVAADSPERAISLFESVAGDLSAEDRLQLYNTMQTAIRQRNDAIMDEAWEYVAAGRRIPADLWRRVPGASKIDIQRELRVRAEGGASTGDRALISDLTIMSVSDPQGFAELNLREVRGALGESAYASLSVEQARIRNGEGRSGISREMANGAMNLAARHLRAAGYDLSPSAKEEDQQAAADFQLDLIGRLDRFVEENSRAPNAQEQIAIVQDLLATRVVREGGWFGWGRREQRYTDFYVPMTEMSEEEIAATRAQLQRRGIEPTRGNIERAFANYRFERARGGERIDR